MRMLLHDCRSDTNLTSPLDETVSKAAKEHFELQVVSCYTCCTSCTHDMTILSFIIIFVADPRFSMSSTMAQLKLFFLLTCHINVKIFPIFCSVDAVGTVLK